MRLHKLSFVAGRAVTNVVRTCGPTHLLVYDFMSNKICLNQVLWRIKYTKMHYIVLCSKY